jgi:hypothetical protein
MTESLTYILSIAIADGPSLAKTDTIEVEAYDVIDVVAPKSTGSPEAQSIHIQPSTTGQVQMIFITSDNYTTISYSVDAVGVSHDLDAPQLFLGVGQIALMGGVPNTLIFTNAGTVRDANIRVVVGRTALAD